MPLNLQDNRDEQFQNKQKPEPILHTPSQSSHLISKVVWIFFSIVALTAIGYLIYIYKVNSGHQETTESIAPEQSQTSQQSSPFPTAAITSPEAMSPDSVQQNSSTPVPQVGRFALYIGAFINRNDAEEEVVRWKDAGFEAYVRESGKWFRVALGRYDHVADASKRAEEYEEAFEQGYWVGPS